MYADEHRDTLPGPGWLGLYYTYNDETERMLYYLAPYLSLPTASVNVCTSLVAICPASARLSREPAGTPPEYAACALATAARRPEIFLAAP